MPVEHVSLQGGSAQGEIVTVESGATEHVVPDRDGMPALLRGYSFVRSKKIDHASGLVVFQCRGKA